MHTEDVYIPLREDSTAHNGKRVPHLVCVGIPVEKYIFHDAQNTPQSTPSGHPPLANIVIYTDEQLLNYPKCYSPALSPV